MDQMRNQVLAFQRKILEVYLLPSKHNGARLCSRGCAPLQSRVRSAAELEDWREEDVAHDRAEAEAYERDRVGRERLNMAARTKKQVSMAMNAGHCSLPPIHSFFYRAPLLQMEAAANQKAAAEAAHERDLSQACAPPLPLLPTVSSLSGLWLSPT